MQVQWSPNPGLVYILDQHLGLYCASESMHLISFADGLPPQRAINAELTTIYDFMCNTCISGEGCRAKAWQLHSDLNISFENWSVDRRRELHLTYNEYEKYAWYISISYGIIDVWDTVSAFTRLPNIFLSIVEFLFEKENGQVTKDLLYIKFTNKTKDNQQQCPWLSNWLPLGY